MKKNIIIGAAILCLILSVGFVNYAKDKAGKGHAKISYYAEDAKSLINDSQFIVFGTAQNIKDTAVNGVNFQLVEFEVDKSTKGDINKKSVIKIIQTRDIAEESLLEKNGKFMLFLEKYSGPIADDAYVIKGLYQGNYKISNGKIKASKDLNKKLKNEIEAISLDEFDSFVNKK